MCKVTCKFLINCSLIILRNYIICSIDAGINVKFIKSCIIYLFRNPKVVLSSNEMPRDALTSNRTIAWIKNQKSCYARNKNIITASSQTRPKPQFWEIQVQGHGEDGCWQVRRAIFHCIQRSFFFILWWTSNFRALWLAERVSGCVGSQMIGWEGRISPTRVNERDSWGSRKILTSLSSRLRVIHHRVSVVIPNGLISRFPARRGPEGLEARRPPPLRQIR